MKGIALKDIMLAKPHSADFSSDLNNTKKIRNGVDFLGNQNFITFKNRVPCIKKELLKSICWNTESIRLEEEFIVIQFYSQALPKKLGASSSMRWEIDAIYAKGWVKIADV